MDGAGSEERSAHWDPMPTACEIVARWRHGPDGISIGTGRWEDRTWLNVPGPFYTGETDTGLNGQVYAPGLVLCGGEWGMEFVYRQPRTPAEVETLLNVAWGQPMGGYAWDGDARWDEASVREWWADRARVREWIANEIRARSTSPADYDRESVPALREFAAHMDSSRVPLTAARRHRRHACEKADRRSFQRLLIGNRHDLHPVILRTPGSARQDASASGRSAVVCASRRPPRVRRASRRSCPSCSVRARRARTARAAQAQVWRWSHRERAVPEPWVKT